MDRDGEFTAYCAARSETLRNTAYLLCGDWHLAHDLTQTALIKLYLAWSRVNRHGALDAYARQVLVRVFLDERRRPWRRERGVADPAVFDRPAHDPAIAERLAVRAALAEVPPRQRAALVLRFWLDLSVDQAAEALRCSPGTVKSQTARGLATLRAALERMPELTEGQRR
ncbi:SigE family RNA polymerase sigma factor [Catellatospora vulcania]|uniref:SigE family RNA polymerase sigma factor n=1 Tax=Catellatospora vulcania TaxID=1460450 RepID=UPI0012D49AFF|nr:SigE family RNA polymerase sigma factor [Catellatospora vulcania]